MYMAVACKRGEIKWREDIFQFELRAVGKL